jgi:hypothetical protein
MIHLVQVSPVSDDNILRLLRDGYDEALDPKAVYDSELEAVLLEISVDAALVHVPEEVLSLLVALRKHLRDEVSPPVYCSDRRLKKAVRVLKVAASAAGRSRVSVVDTLLLQHLLWSRPGDEGTLRDWLLERVVPDSELDALKYLLDGCLARVSKQLDGEDKVCLSAELKSLNETFLPLIVAKIVSFESLAEELRGEVDKANLWLSAEDVVALRQQLEPAASLAARNLRLTLSSAIQTSILAQDYLEDNLTREDLMVLLDKEEQDFEHEVHDETGGFSREELSLSKKEAQRRLGPDDFRRWKKVMRRKADRIEL